MPAYAIRRAILLCARLPGNRCAASLDRWKSNSLSMTTTSTLASAPASLRRFASCRHTAAKPAQRVQLLTCRRLAFDAISEPRCSAYMVDMGSRPPRTPRDGLSNDSGAELANSARQSVCAVSSSAGQHPKHCFHRETSEQASLGNVDLISRGACRLLTSRRSSACPSDDVAAQVAVTGVGSAASGAAAGAAGAAGAGRSAGRSRRRRGG